MPPEALAAAHWGPSKLPTGVALTVMAPGMEPLQVPLLHRADSETRCVPMASCNGRAVSSEAAHSSTWQGNRLLF